MEKILSFKQRKNLYKLPVFLLVFFFVIAMSMPAGYVLGEVIGPDETVVPESTETTATTTEEVILGDETGDQTASQDDTSDSATTTDELPFSLDENGYLVTTENQSEATSSPELATGEEASASTTDAVEGDPSATNSETGAESVNTSETNVSNTTTVTNTNIAKTFNASMLRADTGKNSTSYNSGSGIITTQKAQGNGGVVNVVNFNRISADQPATGPIVAANENTGEGSVNEAEVNINNTLTVRVSNESETVNQIKAEVNSGQNVSGWNTNHGIVLTGDASLGLNFMTMANTNIIGSNRLYADWQNVYSSYNGNIDLASEAAVTQSPLSGMIVEASNKSTGADSSNSAIVNVNDTTEITTVNKGKIDNEIEAKAVSGLNKSNYNTGTGSVTTGNVNASVNVLNFLNSNIISSNAWIKSLNVFGNWTGDLILPRMAAPNLVLGQSGSYAGANTETGAGSENTAEIEVTENYAVENSNEAVITNDVHMVADTGSNRSSYNGASGAIQYGDADAETNEINVANVNVTGDSWWMVIINKFGNWVGTAIGSPSDIITEGTPNTTVITPQGSGIAVQNNSTGPDSNNQAGAYINHSTDISNENDAYIHNKLDVMAVTGQNETQYNTGHGYIDAGDVKASNNIINFANTNINVGNWLVTVVNVFGDWQGDLVFNTGTDPMTDIVGSGEFNVNASSGNAGTGAGSTNDSTTNSTTNTDVNNNNTSDVTNNTSATSLSGENNADYNTGLGIVSTGGATTGSNIGNTANTNTTGIGSGGTSDLSSGNSSTGYESDNSSSASNSSDTTVDNNNNVVANNNLNGTNTTGQSSSSYNTGNGVVDTGWAETYLGLYNQYNDNALSLGELENNLAGGSTTPTDTNNGDSSSGSNSGSPSSNGSGSSSGGATSGGGGGGGGIYYWPTTQVLPAADSTGIKGDVNGDSKINDYDFSIIVANWGAKFKNAKADLNSDGKVDIGDISVLITNWK